MAKKWKYNISEDKKISVSILLGNWNLPDRIAQKLSEVTPEPCNNA